MSDDSRITVENFIDAKNASDRVWALAAKGVGQMALRFDGQSRQWALSYPTPVTE